MHRSRTVLLGVLVAAATLLAGCQSLASGAAQQRAVTTGAQAGFSFAAAGDLGASRETAQ